MKATPVIMSGGIAIKGKMTHKQMGDGHKQTVNSPASVKDGTVATNYARTDRDPPPSVSRLARRDTKVQYAAEGAGSAVGGAMPSGGSTNVPGMAQIGRRKMKTGAKQYAEESPSMIQRNRIARIAGEAKSQGVKPKGPRIPSPSASAAGATGPPALPSASGLSALPSTGAHVSAPAATPTRAASTTREKTLARASVPGADLLAANDQGASGRQSAARAGLLRGGFASDVAHSNRMRDQERLNKSLAGHGGTQLSPLQTPKKADLTPEGVASAINGKKFINEQGDAIPRSKRGPRVRYAAPLATGSLLERGAAATGRGNIVPAAASPPPPAPRPTSGRITGQRLASTSGAASIPRPHRHKGSPIKYTKVPLGGMTVMNAGGASTPRAKKGGGVLKKVAAAAGAGVLGTSLLMGGGKKVPVTGTPLPKPPGAQAHVLPTRAEALGVGAAHGGPKEGHGIGPTGTGKGAGTFGAAIGGSHSKGEGVTAAMKLPPPYTKGPSQGRVSGTRAESRTTRQGSAVGTKPAASKSPAIQRNVGEPWNAYQDRLRAASEATGARASDKIGVSNRGAKKYSKVAKVMKEFSEGDLHSGSKNGPPVKSRKQAVAVALSEARRAGEDVAPKQHAKSDKVVHIGLKPIKGPKYTHGSNKRVKGAKV